ncbi:hypothetical protein [Devosia aurantiaca]|uniref:Uncharacterized protein n=1 Tax=Devosia aurantiaca TaxID=2714858 RepID=A0A6M1SFC6_9HYPH|nr:hypothetical protein [Devosia aurantiaca]NGP18569.1 hypothetical protein [Devosia aurantiaca]
MPNVLEWARPSDLYRDYCLWDYKPIAKTEGKLRQSSLLWQSFETLSASPALRQLVEALRTELGAFQTVWGVKKLAEGFAWELYIYDYARIDRLADIQRVLQTIAPWVPSTITLPTDRPYFMFSFDIDAQLGTRHLDQLSVYIGNPGSSVSSGICYQLTDRGLRMDNLYYFFDARSQWKDIVAKVACSAHIGLREIPLDAILWPELRDCGVIVVANKKHNDGVYFSRITIDQLIFFAQRLNYPEPIKSFLRQNRDRLDHLLYDVGIDYRMIEGTLQVTKSAYYGVV